MDDVSLLELRQRSYVNPMGGGVNIPQVSLAQSLTQKYAQAFKCPAELVAPRRLQTDSSKVVALLCRHEHTRLFAQVEQSRLEAHCSYGCTAAAVGGIDYKYLHSATGCSTSVGSISIE